MAFTQAPKLATLEFEAVARARLIYDLTLSAARQQLRLDVLRVSIDNAGYDVIADWELDRRYLQLKSKEYSSSTRSWTVWARLLKPRFDDLGASNIANWQFFHPYGLNGAVILTEIDSSTDELRVKHYFTDIRILHLLARGIIGDSKQRLACERVIHRLQSEAEFNRSQRVRLSKKHFVLMKNLTALNGLIGLRVPETLDWRQLFYRVFGQPSLVRERFGPGPDPEASKKLIGKIFADEILPFGEDQWMLG